MAIFIKQEFQTIAYNKAMNKGFTTLNESRAFSEYSSKTSIFFISTTLFIAFTSCNSPLPDIPIEKVKIDTTTNIYTYRDSNKKVTGNLISKDNFNDIPVKVVEKVIDGRRLSCFAYYPNGNKYN